MSSGKERERAWILNPMRFSRKRTKWRQLNIEASASHRIGYIISDDNGELRVVEKEGWPHNDYFLTVKSAGNEVRDEFEVHTPSWVFENLWSHTIDARVYKTRYYMIQSLVDEHDNHVKDLVLELDEYTDEKGLNPWFYRLECEFDNEEESKLFELPKIFKDCSHEVTSDKRFKNRNIAIHGLPCDWRHLFKED